MFYKVKIKRLPQARFGRNVKTGQQMDGALAIQPTAMGGADIDQYMGEKPLKTVNTLNAVPREEANLEAEGGETAYGDLNGDGMAEHAKIVGPRHSNGGVPLNLPDDTFIYSDTRSMMIKDPKLLSLFGKATSKGKKSKGFTPAELAKQYDVNKYRKLLQDPNSDAIDKKTAELMIENYTMKLGALALAQESKKGFPQGIPVVSKPYMEANKISEEDIMPTYKSMSQAQQGMQMQQPMQEEEIPTNEQGIPTEMPSGEPIAMSPQMQGQEQPMPPMAQYGMMMGGYDMPFYPQMAYGGLTQYQEKGEVTVEGIKANPVTEAPSGTDWKSGTVTGGGEGAQGFFKITESGERVRINTPLRGGSGSGNFNRGKWENAICNEIKKGSTEADVLKRHYSNNPKYKATVQKLFGECFEAANETFQEKKEAVYLTPKADTPCNPCSDGITPTRTPDGKCPCEEKKCNACPDGTVPEMTADGKCPCGETTEETVQEEAIAPPQPTMTAAGWTAPDIKNYYGAFKDKYSIKPYYPWAARADLEEPTNILYDPTRELAQQSEQTNILTQGLAQFAGPQALSSRASQLQGTAAEQAANTLSRYNNLNVGLENQFALTQNQIRNQEKMLNQATAKELYDKTMMTKQQYDNSKRQADANVRQSFATGWKNASDIAMLNSMQEQYKVDPYSGTVFHTGVGKAMSPEKPAMTPSEYWNSPEVAALTDKAKESLIAKKFSKYGGNMKDGGIYVMGSNVFPFMFY